MGVLIKDCPYRRPGRAGRHARSATWSRRRRPRGRRPRGACASASPPCRSAATAALTVMRNGEAQRARGRAGRPRPRSRRANHRTDRPQPALPAPRSPISTRPWPTRWGSISVRARRHRHRRSSLARIAERLQLPARRHHRQGQRPVDRQRSRPAGRAGGRRPAAGDISIRRDGKTPSHRGGG